MHSCLCSCLELTKAVDCMIIGEREMGLFYLFFNGYKTTKQRDVTGFSFSISVTGFTKRKSLLRLAKSALYLANE